MTFSQEKVSAVRTTMPFCPEQIRWRASLYPSAVLSANAAHEAVTKGVISAAMPAATRVPRTTRRRRVVGVRLVDMVVGSLWLLVGLRLGVVSRRLVTSARQLRLRTVPRGL